VRPEQRGKGRQLARKTKVFGEEYRGCGGTLVVL
jgi:hypothetical protein